MMKTTALASLLFSSTFAFAHPGHGIAEQHPVNPRLSDLITAQSLSTLPEMLSVSIWKDGVKRSLELRQFSILSSNFCVRLDYGYGFHVILPHDGKTHTYQGYLSDDPGSLVSAWIDERGIEAEVYQSNGTSWGILPPETTGEEHIVVDRQADDSTPLVDQLNARQHALLAQLDNATATMTQALALPKEVTVKKAEIAFDVSNRTFREGFKGDKKGADFSRNGNYGYGFEKNPELAKRYIQSFLNTMNGVYMRDSLVKFELGVVNIRMDAKSCPYEKEAITIPNLERFRDVWNGKNKSFGPPPSKTHHLAHAMIGNRGGASGYAWVGTVNETNRYSIGGTSVGSGLNFWKGIATHEILHNWGGQHGDGSKMEFSTSGGTYSAGMSHGDRGRMNPVEQKKALAERDSSKLPDLGSIPEETRKIAPYGGFDNYTVAAGGPPILLDVLANDHDANNTPFELSHFVLHRSGKNLAVKDAKESRKGGVLEIAAGEGPGGRDMLRYTPPILGSGTDQFIYVIKDKTNRNGMGTVKITLTANDPGIILASTSLPGFESSETVTFSPGLHRMEQLNRTNIKSGEASSMKVPLNYEVALFKEDSLDQSKGHAICGPGAYELSKVPLVDEKNKDLRMNADRRISALKVTFTGPDRPHVIVCDKPDFQGTRGLFNGSEPTGFPGAYPAALLDWAGLADDEIASIRIPKGYTVTLFTDNQFKGEEITLTESVRDLKELQFGGKVSSMQIVYSEQ